MRGRGYDRLAICAIVLCAALILPVVSSFASETGRRIEEEKRLALAKTEEVSPYGHKTLVFDYGGWLDFRYDDYRDDDNDSSLPDTVDYVNSLDARFWLKAILRPPAGASYTNVHYAYVRLREFFLQSYPNDKEWKNKNSAPIVEYAYAVLDLHPIWIEAGRQYISIGKGLAYSDVNDGVQLFISSPEWRFKALIAGTLPHQDNIDVSVPGSINGSERYFYGFEAAYSFMKAHSLYSYFLIQRDRTKEYPPDDLQDYLYNSEYLSFGAQGSIIPQVRYLAEVIRESGSSYIFPDNSKASVDAWAGIFEVMYSADIYSHPSLSCSYAFGSGDKDRISVTDTIGGNISGIDRNFLYFGYIPTGFALAPRLSNLHFLKGRVSLFPFENCLPLKQLSVDATYYRYYKFKPAGGIYDYDAIDIESYVGDEVDVELAWQIASDLNLTLQYGHFFPGEAYIEPANDPEDYFSISLALSF